MGRDEAASVVGISEGLPKEAVGTAVAATTLGLAERLAAGEVTGSGVISFVVAPTGRLAGKMVGPGEIPLLGLPEISVGPGGAPIEVGLVEMIFGEKLGTGTAAGDPGKTIDASASGFSSSLWGSLVGAGTIIGIPDGKMNASSSLLGIADEGLLPSSGFMEGDDVIIATLSRLNPGSSVKLAPKVCSLYSL